MDKHQNIPLSIERFAAYLDHNLPDDEMQAIDNVVSKNESLNQLAALSKEADTFMTEWQPEEIPFDTNSIDFELPQIETFNSSDNELGFATFGDIANFDASLAGDENFDNDSPFQTYQDIDLNHDGTLNTNDDSLDLDDGTSSFDDTLL